MMRLLQQFHPQELHTAAFLQPKVSNELENKADRHTHTHDAAASQSVSDSQRVTQQRNTKESMPVDVLLPNHGSIPAQLLCLRKMSQMTNQESAEIHPLYAPTFTSLFQLSAHHALPPLVVMR
jgi:hypothetical protein